jgi:hypothetical protein
VVTVTVTAVYFMVKCQSNYSFERRDFAPLRNVTYRNRARPFLKVGVASALALAGVMLRGLVSVAFNGPDSGTR